MKANKEVINLELISISDLIVFPNTVVSIFIKNDQITNILKTARDNNEKLALGRLRLSRLKEYKLKEKIGSLVKIIHVSELPNDSTKVIIEGIDRIEISNVVNEKGSIKCNAVVLKEDQVKKEKETLEIKSTARMIFTELYEYILFNTKLNHDLIENARTVEDPSVLADMLAFYLIHQTEKKQKMLSILSTSQRLQEILIFIKEEIDLFKIKKDVDYKIQSQMDKNQREMYLQEKIRYLKRELGEKNTADEIIEKYQADAEKRTFPIHVQERVQEELEKLEFTPINGSEFGLIRSYLDTIYGLPWDEYSLEQKDISKIKNHLNNTHYGMEDVKKRIVEMIAIRIRGGTSKKNVLCLYGSPGTGKTSFAKSIAEALGREFIKVSLGGIQDEAEIRGHRRTYIGAMPGKIISAMKKAKVNNPVILMDEIDKISSNSRGDPVAALLEVLDPEQNQSFQDHYLDLEYDLSNAIFIATANTLHMSGPLLDRLEIIKIPSYLEEEKLNITQTYLIPKISKETGLTDKEIEIKEEAVTDMIKHYTREGGLRSLERQITKVFRKVNLEILESESESVEITKKGRKSKKNETADLEPLKIKKPKKMKKVVITTDNIEKYLGIKKYTHESIEKQNMVGIVNGLAYSEGGGDVLILESVQVPGKGEIKYTGTLGDVMKESMQIAFTFIKSRLEELHLDKEWLKDKDVHLHVPDGATPKDGPSAGIAIALAIYSTMSGKKIINTVAMTGEISLRGKILPIGGLREKLTSAVRGGVKEVIIPKENEKDLEEIPLFVKEKLTIHKLEYFKEVLDIAVSKD